MTRTQQEDYLDYLIQAIAKQDNFSQDMQTGCMVYCSDHVEWMYCTPAWEQFEDPTAPFPADDNVKIYIQWSDGVANDYNLELDYLLQWDIDKDLESYMAIMADFLNNQDNF